MAVVRVPRSSGRITHIERDGSDAIVLRCDKNLITRAALDVDFLYSVPVVSDDAGSSKPRRIRRSTGTP